ncbi:MAG: DUF2281 domain-containing protein [Pyrinomonadaceae bacterium]
MTSEEVLLEKYKILPGNRKQELLDFAEFLTQKENEGHELIAQDLTDLDEGEIQHLEMEFEDYDDHFPRQITKNGKSENEAKASPQQRADAVERWAKGHSSDTPVILDDRREIIYED